MQRVKASIIIIMTGLLVVPVGCGPQEQELAQAAQLTGAPELPGPGFHPHHQALTETVKQLKLRPDQRERLNLLIKQTQAKMAPARKARSEMLLEVAQQVRSGIVDTQRLKQQAEKLHRVARGAKPTIAAALNQLHQTLDASQRAQLVDSLPAHRFKGRMGKRHRMIKHLVDAVGLTEDQRDQIRDVIIAAFKGNPTERLRRMGQMMQQLADAAEAFKSERFDANQFELLKGPHKHGEEIMTRGVTAAQQVLPLLTPSQRAALANLIELRAQRMERGFNFSLPPAE
jgi:Spy/CpxP family protein refolding chaperone